LKRLLVALLVLFVLLNALAFAQAWSMLHFVPSGTRTPVPERLGTLDKARVLLLGVRIPKPVNDRTPDLPYETVKFRTKDGLTLEGWWIPHPNPRAVVLMFHGYAGWKASMLEDARAFHALGCACFLVDERGSGGSDGMATSVGWHEVNDVRAAVDRVRAHEAPKLPLVLYGQSMGGAVILRTLSLDPKGVDGAIVENVFDTMLNAIKNRFALMRLPAFPAAQLLCFWGGVQSGFNAFAHEPVAYASRVRLPVLDLQGDVDPRATVPQATRVFDSLAGPKRFVVFPGIDHRDLATADPARWNGAVDSFLRGLADPADSAHAPGDLRTPGGKP
jgi:hypothetical protein